MYMLAIYIYIYCAHIVVGEVSGFRLVACMLKAESCSHHLYIHYTLYYTYCICICIILHMANRCICIYLHTIHYDIDLHMLCLIFHR